MSILTERPGYANYKQEPLSFYKEVNPDRKVKRIKYAVVTVEFKDLVMWYLHRSVVVVYKKSKQAARLDTDGWPTKTTMQTMNMALVYHNIPFRLFQKDYIWYIRSGRQGKTMEFRNGMWVSAEGEME